MTPEIIDILTAIFDLFAGLGASGFIDTVLSLLLSLFGLGA